MSRTGCHRRRNPLGLVGLPFLWLIVASLWLAFAPMWYLVKAIVLGVAYLARRHNIRTPRVDLAGWSIQMTPMGFRPVYTPRPVQAPQSPAQWSNRR